VDGISALGGRGRLTPKGRASIAKPARGKTVEKEERMSPLASVTLLATDGSREAEHAARMAVELSRSLDSALHVVYVEPLPDPLAWPEAAILNPEDKAQIRERAEEDARKRLGQEAERIRGMGGEVAEAHARSGRPDAEIVSLAEDIAAGLVVVGGRGLGPIRRAVLGSVSESVVRHAHCPVLVVRGHAEEAPHLGPIVLAIDGSEEARLAAQAAAELSEKTGSEIHLVYVMPAEAQLVGYHLYSQDVKESLLEGARKEARRFLDDQAVGVRSAGGVVANSYLASGRADEEVVKLAEEIGAGMVVVGSRGMGGVRRALMGSVSESVVRHAHCPVLVVRSAVSHEGASERTQ
jgi:nucleotide-binding universal stress UspA family protein